MRSLYSASSEYLKLTHPLGRSLASNREIKRFILFLCCILLAFTRGLSSNEN